MKLSQLDYTLPPQLIAHSPTTPRDHSKLMVINRVGKSITHKHFYDLADLLTSNDVLVFNQTKVFPARLFGERKTGGKVELLLLNKVNDNSWEIIGKNVPHMNDKIFFDSFEATVVDKTNKKVVVEFNLSEEEFWDKIYTIGHIPLPPYIKSALPESKLKYSYQTIYAKDLGSVAAPTAGFHFTNDLLAKLRKKGVDMEYVTLHVGLGTFLPIKTDDLTKHAMHSERFTLTNESALRLNELKVSGKRIVAVGTTTTRVLESCTHNGKLKSATGDTDIFIYPPYKFKFVDALITNFHLPHSTLLALVSAFVSYPNTNQHFTDFKSSLMGKAYVEAINNQYRFYSFGDSSLII